MAARCASGKVERIWVLDWVPAMVPACISRCAAGSALTEYLVSRAHSEPRLPPRSRHDRRRKRTTLLVWWRRCSQDCLKQQAAAVRRARRRLAHMARLRALQTRFLCARLAHARRRLLPPRRRRTDSVAAAAAQRAVAQAKAAVHAVLAPRPIVLTAGRAGGGRGRERLQTERV